MKRLLLVLLATGCATRPIAITGATLIDGSGSEPQPNVTVVIRGDQIAAVRPETVPSNAQIIDAHGRVLAPGFIDMHNHSDRGLKDDPSLTSQVSQGITTIVVGQDGESAYPIGDFLTRLDHSPVAVNVATFVGQATLRERVMGEKNLGRAATDQEVATMTEMVRNAMRDGAFGLSTGLEYEEAKKSTTGEVIALARAAAEQGGVYMSHIRDEAQVEFPALDEAVRIGSEARLPVEISHIKMGSKSVWGRAPDAVRLVEAARQRGIDVTADCYPYEAWYSTIRVLVPSGRLDNAADVAAALEENGGANRITIVHCKAHPDYESKNLQQIADEKHITPVEAYMQIVRDGGADVIGHTMQESDVRTFYTQPWVMVGSDGGVGGKHPRSAGTFPRVLGRYVREQHWLTLQEAVRKMTSLPASRLKLADRGLIRPGMKADLVLFDADKVIDRSTFRDPGLLPEGIENVFVNGVEVWRNGAVTGERPGRALRKR
jgi:N-acyl-D-amino-acid deacylase